jgi:predicted dehydrogenase
MMMLDAKPLAKKNFRAVIIGCGQVAGGYDEYSSSDLVNTHAKAYQVAGTVDLFAASDIDSRKAAKFCATWQVPTFYSDVAEMLEKERPEIVSICTPISSHAALLELCLHHSCVKAVWCEKPLAGDVNKAAEIVLSYAEKGVVLAVNYSRRWDKRMIQIKDALQNKELGRIQKIIAYYTKGLCNNGSHAIDMLLYWFGKPDEIKVLRTVRDSNEADATVDACLMFGPVSAYVIGLNDIKYKLFEIQILGSEGRIDIQSGTQIEWFKTVGDLCFPADRKLERKVKYETLNDSNSMIVALDEIVGAVLHGGSVRSNGESALATLRICRQLVEHGIEKC